jgi:hypothetical protein
MHHGLFLGGVKGSPEVCCFRFEPFWEEVGWPKILSCCSPYLCACIFFLTFLTTFVIFSRESRVLYPLDLRVKTTGPKLLHQVAQYTQPKTFPMALLFIALRIFKVFFKGNFKACLSCSCQLQTWIYVLY